MVVTTATPVRATSCAALASAPRISPTTMMSGLKRREMSTRSICSMRYSSFSLFRVRVCTTELVTLPSCSRMSDNSRLPFSMVKIRLLSGIVVKSQPATVVLPLLVAPAMHTEMPYRMNSDSKSSIGAVAVPPFMKSSFSMLLGFTIRMDAAAPTLASTIGLFITAIRIFSARVPTTSGD